jgi:hypothetical protein
MFKKISYKPSNKQKSLKKGLKKRFKLKASVFIISEKLIIKKQKIY